MNIFRRHRLALLGGFLTVAAIAVWTMQPAFLIHLDGIAYDAHCRAASAPEPSGEVVIVEIDEASVQRFGQWPWPRRVLAQLVGELQDAGGSVIAIDAVFAEPEQRLAEKTLPPATTTGRASVTGLQSEGDARLALALKPGRVVLGHYFRFDNQSGSTTCALHPLSLSTAFRFDAKREPYLLARSVTCSLAKLSFEAVGTGFLNASPDSDGILRRVPLVIGYEDQAYPSLALAAVMAHWQVRTAQLRQEDDGSEWLRVNERAIPVGPYSTMMLRFGNSRTAVPRISASSITANVGKLRGKIVLVGGSAAGLQDRVATSVLPEVPGLDVHATAIENLLTGVTFQRPPNARLAELILVGLSGALSTWLLLRFHPWGASLGIIGLLVVLWLGTSKLMDLTGIFVSPALAISLVVINLAVLAVVSFSIQKDRANRGEAQAEAARQFMVSMLTNLAHVRDVETGEHLMRMRRTTWVLCVALRSHPRFKDVLSPERVELVTELVPLHDIGKVAVPDAILRKPGRLTPEEFEEIKKHVDYGRAALTNARGAAILLDDLVFDIAYKIVCHHHERWDGAGYPSGLCGEEISPEGRIVAIVDVYDALVSDRVYKKAISHEEALDILRQGRGTHFDPGVVDAFLRVEQTIRRTHEEIHRNPPSIVFPEV